MRVLKAKRIQFSTHFINHDGDLEHLSVTSEPVKLDEICPGMLPHTRLGVPGFSKLEHQIINVEMKNPIILVPNTELNYRNGLFHIEQQYKFNYTIELPYLCIFGSQRIAIALKHGMDAIDAFIFPDVNKGVLVGKLLESKDYLDYEIP